MNLYEALADNPFFVRAITPDQERDYSLNVDPSQDDAPDWTPPPFDEVAASLSCHECESCYKQWCRAVIPGSFYNVRLLRVCPKKRAREDCLPTTEIWKGCKDAKED